MNIAIWARRGWRSRSLSSGSTTRSGCTRRWVICRRWSSKSGKRRQHSGRRREFLRHGQSIHPMGSNSRKQASRLLPALIGTDESQPVIPWWVALPQSPPPLHRMRLECRIVVLPVDLFAANGNVGLNCLSQPRGQPQRDAFTAVCIPSAAKAGDQDRLSTYGLKPVPFKAEFLDRFSVAKARVDFAPLTARLKFTLSTKTCRWGPRK